MSTSNDFSDQKSTEFMALLGTCITEWAWIEEEIYGICQMILGTASVHTSIIYYRTPSLEARLKLVDELMETVFPPPENGKHKHSDADVWKKLSKGIQDQMPVRNQLAHSPTAMGIWGTVDDETGKVSQVVELKMQSSPHRHEMNRPKGTSKKMLLKQDLEKHLQEVREIHMRLRTFRLGGLYWHISKRVM